MEQGPVTYNQLLELDRKCSVLETEVNYLSYNLILLRKYLAYKYMCSGVLTNVDRSVELIEKSIKDFENGNFTSPEQFSTYFQLKLILALSNEFYNKHNEAYSEYEKTIAEIEKYYGFVNEDTKNLFYRCLYILSPIPYFQKKIKNYTGHNIISSFQNKRRIVEKKIIRGTVKEEDILEINQQFEQIKSLIDKLHHVTHYRLMFQYYLRKKEMDLANYYYKLAIQTATEYGFSGQIKQIEIIREQK